MTFPWELVRNAEFLVPPQTCRDGYFDEGAWGGPDIWETLFLICLGGCFPEETHSEINELSKADGPPRCGRVSSNLLRA